MSGRLQDRIAIVTGAGCVGPGWGNGRAFAVRFAQEGAKIFAVDRDLDSVAETVERVTAVGGEIAVHGCVVRRRLHQKSWPTRALHAFPASTEDMRSYLSRAVSMRVGCKSRMDARSSRDVSFRLLPAL